jgi:hypothetical protein
MAAKRTSAILTDMTPCSVCHTTGVDPTSVEEGIPERCKSCGGVGYVKPLSDAARTADT